MRPSSNNNTDRLAKEKLAGYERPRVPRAQNTPAFPAAAAVQQLQAQAAQLAQQSQFATQTAAKQRSVPVQMKAAAPAPRPPVAPAAPNVEALGAALMQRFDGKLKEENKNVRGLLDSLSLRTGTIENSLKSVQLSCSSLRDEFSGIAQVAGGSVATRVDGLELVIKSLEQSVAEASAEVKGLEQSLEARVGAMREETTNKFSDMAAAMQSLYERMVTVRATLIEGSAGFATGEEVTLHYPMVNGEAGEIYMGCTHVTHAGDVEERMVCVRSSVGTQLATFL